ncbi:autotransporter assembly complex protein TamA [Vibrio rarus]|uniref:autotransporter assembly complex protein TamA n=1 Tax=Vibrio rarus TaxID=413403 RepID=UPI0021C2FB00|nr:autotransporter assembly complex family protein [Vibrio rarus]
MNQRVIRIFIAFVLLVFSQLSQAEATLNVNGLSGKVEDNVEAYLSAIPEEEYSTSLRFQSRIESSITQAVRALGYYHPSIHFTVDEDDQTLNVDVELGEPVVIDTMDIEISGEAKDDPQFLGLIESSKLKPGAVLSHGDYDALKSGLRNLALKRGYFEGDFSVSRLEIAPELNKAFIHLHYASGIRYHFGHTQISGSQIEQDRVYSLIPFKQGDPYSAGKIGQLNQNLSSTSWFSTVYVEPDLSGVGEGNRELPMTIQLSPQSRNQVDTGIGYSTDVGVRGSLSWRKPWLNAQGHSFDSSFSLSKPEQQVVLGYKIPLQDVLREYYRIQYGMKYLDNNDTTSLESSLGLERHWQLDSGWHRTLFIRLLNEDFTQGAQEDTFTMLLPGISFSKTRTRGGAMPTWGDKQSVTLEYGDPAVISEARVLRVLGRTTWIRSYNRNHRGIFYIGGGANFTESVFDLPPSLRFFAGGDNNLRGYKYESISPKDSKDKLTGAKYMATTSLEYQYRVYGNWWLATFVDYGDAWNETPQWKTGTGVGIRWASPVGPVRLDFAFGLDAEEGTDKFQLHFGLGPEL